jgi:FkbM family methyltransferase
MLIEGVIIKSLLDKYGIQVRGALHIGAHECEERNFYKDILNIVDERVIWVDGNIKKVDQMKQQGFNNMYYSVLDEIERDIMFNITDNTQASSILKLNHSAGFYNYINIVDSVLSRTEKLSSFLTRINKNVYDYNFWNLDIQGSELHVLRGSKELLENCDAIYTEVNLEQVYSDCGLISEIDTLLAEYGFKRVETRWTDVKWGDALYLKTHNSNNL